MSTKYFFKKSIFFCYHIYTEELDQSALWNFSIVLLQTFFVFCFLRQEKNALRTFSGGKCIAVPNTDDVLEIFGFGYSGGYVSPSVSPKDSSEHDMKPIVQVVTGKYPSIQWYPDVWGRNWQEGSCRRCNMTKNGILEKFKSSWTFRV